MYWGRGGGRGEEEVLLVNLLLTCTVAKQENEVTPTNEQPASKPAPGQEDFKNFDIVRATQYGVFPRVKELIEAGFDVNQMDKENVSLLHWAAINNRIDIVK